MFDCQTASKTSSRSVFPRCFCVKTRIKTPSAPSVSPLLAAADNKMLKSDVAAADFFNVPQSHLEGVFRRRPVVGFQLYIGILLEFYRRNDELLTRPSLRFFCIECNN